MKRLFTTALLAVFCLSLGAQEEVVRLFTENPDRSANNMHSYEFNPIVDTKAPKGFKPFYISHYGRHGSRYEQNATFARNAMNAFPVLDSLGLLTEAKEHQMLAARMVERFPAVFKNKDRWEVNSFSSTNFRCIVSMCNFTNSMKAASPRQEFTYTSAERFMGYINPSLRVPRPGEVPAPRPSFSPEQMARMRGGNPESSKYTPATGTPGYDFTRFLTPLFKDYDAALKVLGNPEPEPFVKACFSAGGLCQVIDFLGIDILRKYFVPEELVYLWASGNDSIYRMWGGSVENGDVIRFAIRPLMMDFIEKADAAMQPGSHRTADLRFGHDTSILPLFALMGVDDPQNRRLPYKEAHAKGWYAFFQVPMATNCQMIFYQNKKGEVLTKVLYNPYYRWDELKAHFLDLCKQASAPWDNWNRTHGHNN